MLKLWDAPPFAGEAAFEDATARGRDDVDDESGDDDDDGIPRSLRPDVSPSSYSLLGELGVLSSCGTERPFHDPAVP